MSTETILSSIDNINSHQKYCSNLCLRFQKLFLISLNPRINGGGVRYGQAVFKERERHIQSYLGTIHPYSFFRWYWDILLTIVLLFAIIQKPVQIAYYDIEDYDVVVIFSTITSILFFLDIGFNFCTGIADTRSDQIILDRKIICAKYLRSWFLIDFLSSIPFDTIYYIVTWIHPEPLLPGHTMYFKYIRLLGLLKFFRLIRVIQCLTRIEQGFKISELRIRLINLLVTILTIIHWMSCFHWLAADLFNPPDHRKKLSWVTKTNLWDKPVWLCYINSVLRTVSNMVTSGYGGGDVPTEPEDILMTLISMALGCTCFGLYIGTMGSIIQRVNASGKKFDEMMLEVNEYMKFRNIPLPLQKKMRLYFEQRYRKHYFDENGILGNVSDVLRNEILMYNCKHLLENVPLFRQLPDSILKLIVQKLRFQIYLPGDMIIEIGSHGQAMYFIQEGKVGVTTKNGEIVSVLQSGDYFGEGSLVTDNQTKTNANVIARDYCDVYRLDREDFIEIFKDHPETLESIKSVAQSRRNEMNKKTNVSKFNISESII